MLPLVHFFWSLFSQNWLRPNVIVNIRTGKGKETEIFILSNSFVCVVGRPTTSILWAASVSSLSAISRKVTSDLVKGLKKSKKEG